MRSGANKIALVLAAHGDRGLADRNAVLARHAITLADGGAFATVRYGVLNGEPRLPDALREAENTAVERIFVYPFFMSDGFFVSTRLPERIAKAELQTPFQVTAPLGLDPALPQLLLRRSLNCAAGAAFKPAGTRLLIVGHGSKFGRASAQATKKVADTVRSQARFAAVETAFLEERPFIADALQDGALPTVIAGFFSGEGMHGHDDLPKAIASAGCPCVYTRPIGADPEIPRLIEAAVLNAAQIHLTC